MIYIVTPVFNRKTFTQHYLKALSKQTVKEFKTIIIDDGCTDGTAEMIENEFPEVILLKEKGDLWWTAATNIGVKYALAQDDVEYIMTLNDDTLPQKDYIEKMIHWINQKPNVLLGALAIDVTTNKIMFGGENLNWKSGKFESLLPHISDENRKGLHEVNVFPGRGLLIPRTVFKDIGMYDSNNFPQTYADLDFTARASNFGYEIYCNYDARIKIYPDESGGVALKKDKNIKNFYRHLFGMKGAGNLKWFIKFAIKNAPKKYVFTYTAYGITARIGGYLRDWVKGK